MPRAVLDVNVLVSALITPQGATARLLVKLRAGAFELVVSPRLLDELAEILGRAKIRRYVTTGEAAAYVDLIRRDSVLVDDPAPSPEPIGRDPDDEYLIDLARVARVDALVSGDAHLLGLADRLPVASPSAFLASLDEAL